MKSFRAFLLWVALAGAAIAQPASVAVPSHANPALASFADIYRITVTVSDPLAGPYGSARQSAAEDVVRDPAAAQGPLRVSSAPAETAPISDVQFRVTPAREPERWLLLLAGLALAGWVAHRRLVNWF